LQSSQRKALLKVIDAPPLPLPSECGDTQTRKNDGEGEIKDQSMILRVLGCPEKKQLPPTITVPVPAP
jgi:hypothetical protein